MGDYIDATQLSRRMTTTCYQGTFNDAGTGTVDTDAVAQVIRDAEAYVNGFLRGIYPTIPVSPVPDQVMRITLDVAEAYAYQRNGTLSRRDPEVIIERARKDLVDIRNGKIRLDVDGAPEPAANQGGSARSGDPDDPDPPSSVFLGGLGDY